MPRSRGGVGLVWVGLLVVANAGSAAPPRSCEHETCTATSAPTGGETASWRSAWDSHSFCGAQEESGAKVGFMNASSATHGQATRLREYRISMPLTVEEFTRGRDFTLARINELEEDGKGGRGVKVRNSTK